MKSSILEKDGKIENNIIKDMKKLFRTKMETTKTAIKDIKKILLDQKKRISQLKIE